MQNNAVIYSYEAMGYPQFVFRIINNEPRGHKFLEVRDHIYCGQNVHLARKAFENATSDDIPSGRKPCSGLKTLFERMQKEGIVLPRYCKRTDSVHGEDKVNKFGFDERIISITDSQFHNQRKKFCYDGRDGSF